MYVCMRARGERRSRVDRKFLDSGVMTAKKTSCLREHATLLAKSKAYIISLAPWRVLSPNSYLHVVSRDRDCYNIPVYEFIKYSCI